MPIYQRHLTLRFSPSSEVVGLSRMDRSERERVVRSNLVLCQVKPDVPKRRSATGKNLTLLWVNKVETRTGIPSYRVTQGISSMEERDRELCFRPSVPQQRNLRMMDKFHYLPSRKAIALARWIRFVAKAPEGAYGGDPQNKEVTMDFDLSEDQRLLKDSVDRLMADQYQFEQRKKYMSEPAGYSAAMWDQITEMGLLGLPFQETLGGFGGGAVETAIVMDAFGRGLVLEPYFATVILGGGLLRRAGLGVHAGCAGAQGRRRQAEAGLRACRTALAIRCRGCQHDGTQGWRRLRPGWREKRGDPRRQRRPHLRHRPVVG